MAIDASIYGLLDTKGLQQGLAGIGEAYASGVERRNRLAQLDKQGQLTDQQIAAGKRAEEGYPAEQEALEKRRKFEDEDRYQKVMKEHQEAVARGAVTNEEIDAMAQDAYRRGVPSDVINQNYGFYANMPMEKRAEHAQANSGSYDKWLESRTKAKNPQDEVFKTVQDTKGAYYGLTKSGKTIPLDVNGQQIVGRNDTGSNSGFQAVPITDPVTGETTWGAFSKGGGGISQVKGGWKNPIYTPETQGAIAGAKVTGKDQAKAKISLPANIQEAENTLKLVDDLIAHPGFKQAVGTSSLVGVQYVPGTAAKDFKIREEQLLGKQFLQAYETLKGGGQITEIEGKKATDAMSRMRSAGTEDAYIEAANEFKEIIKQGVERARNRAGEQYPKDTPQTSKKIIKTQSGATASGW